MATKAPSPDTPSNGQGEGTPPVLVAAPSAVAREMHSFVADIEDLITSTTSLTGEDLARTKARLGERVAAAKKAVGDAGTAVAHGARRGATVTNDYVRQNPWKAVGIGAAAGVLLGFLLSRRA